MVTDDAGHGGIDSSTPSPGSTAGSRKHAQGASNLLKGLKHTVNLR